MHLVGLCMPVFVFDHACRNTLVAVLDRLLDSGMGLDVDLHPDLGRLNRDARGSGALVLFSGYLLL